MDASVESDAAVQSLFETMARRTDQRCEEIVAEARREAERILDDGRRQAEEYRSTALDDLRVQLEREAQPEQDRIRVEIGRRRRLERYRIVDDMLTRVRQSLDRVAEGETFGEIIEKLLQEAVEAAVQEGGNDLLAAVPARHIVRCREWLRTAECARGVAVGIDPEAGLVDGVIVRDRIGTFRITNTLSMRFDRVENEMRKHCMDTLFGSEGNG